MINGNEQGQGGTNRVLKNTLRSTNAEPTSYYPIKHYCQYSIVVQKLSCQHDVTGGGMLLSNDFS